MIFLIFLLLFCKTPAAPKKSEALRLRCCLDGPLPQSSTLPYGRFFSTVLDEVTESARAGGALAGSNFWAYAGAGRPVATPMPTGKKDGACGPAPFSMARPALAHSRLGASIYSFILVVLLLSSILHLPIVIQKSLIQPLSRHWIGVLTSFPPPPCFSPSHTLSPPGRTGTTSAVPHRRVRPFRGLLRGGGLPPRHVPD